MAIALAFAEHSQQVWMNPLQYIAEDILTRTEKQKLLESIGKLMT